MLIYWSSLMCKEYIKHKRLYTFIHLEQSMSGDASINSRGKLKKMADSGGGCGLVDRP